MAETIALALSATSIFARRQVARPWVVEYLSATFNVGSQQLEAARSI